MLRPGDIKRGIAELRQERRRFALAFVDPSRGSSPGEVVDAVTGLDSLVEETGFACIHIPYRPSEPATSLDTLRLLPVASGLTLQAVLVWTWSITVKGDRIGRYRPSPSARFIDATHGYLLLLSPTGQVSIPTDATTTMYVPYGRELPPTWRVDEEPVWNRAKDFAGLKISLGRLSDLASEGLLRTNGQSGQRRRVCRKSVLRYRAYKATSLTSAVVGELPRGVYDGVFSITGARRAAFLGNAGNGVLAAVAAGFEAVGYGAAESAHQRLEILRGDPG